VSAANKRDNRIGRVSLALFAERLSEFSRSLAATGANVFLVKNDDLSDEQ
jgi:hypothetical protein